MNLQKIREAAIAQVVAPTQSEQLVNVNEKFVDLMVNKGYHQIERRALWKFSEAEAPISASAGTREAQGLPSDYGLPLMVWSDRMKAPLTFHDDRQRFFDLNAEGEVTYYGVWERDIKFYPLPKRNETFLLRYYKTWPDLEQDNDEPIIPETWHDLLIDYASYWTALRLPPTGDRFLPNSRAEPYLQVFEARLEEMANSDLVMPTWDEVPNYGFQENVLSLEGEAW